MQSPYPYRQNVQMWIFNDEGKLLVNDESTATEVYWKFPQGGVNAGETNLEAIKRELMEELSISDYEILAEAPFKAHYEWNEKLQEERKLRGQEQTIYLVYLKNTSQIKIGEPNIRSCEWLTFEQALKKFHIPSQIETAKKIWKEFEEMIVKKKSTIRKK